LDPVFFEISHDLHVKLFQLTDDIKMISK